MSKPVSSSTRLGPHQSSPPLPSYLPLTSSHQHYQSSQTSPLHSDLPTYNQSTIDQDQQPVASSSRPPARRASSSASTAGSAMSSASGHSPDPSTAPTTPSLHATHRQWIPTPNVPSTFRRQHTMRRISSNGGEERNRWLSEDEGLEGVARTIGRRRRRSSDMGGRSGSGSGPGPGPGPSSGGLHDPSSGSSGGHSHDRDKKPRHKAQSMSRPLPTRAFSFGQQPAQRPGDSDATHSAAAGIGAEPPRIQDLVPPPSTPVTIGLGINRSDLGKFQPTVASGIHAMDQQVPDFARGRGGDGIGGINRPVQSDAGPFTRRKQEQQEMVAKLRRVLGCALCPAVNGVQPPLHHPITLPCGHTLSAVHIYIPVPPPIATDAQLPHDIFLAQQRQHQQRLTEWASVMCPIPTCKRYSPNASSSAVVPDISTLDPSSAAVPVSSGAQRGEMLASGVTYYPPVLPPPPAYSADQYVAENGNTLLDISVDKVLHLVLTEKARQEDRSMMMREPAATSDTDDSEEEGDAYRTSLRWTTSHVLGQSTSGHSGALSPTSPLAPQLPKRQRNTLRNTAGQTRPTGNADEWDFQKELGAVLECDVCAMMLYEPVTTPCQHSFCSKCLSRSLDHSSRCPVCRQDLPSFAFFQDHAVNRVLVTILKTAFPVEYEDRQKALEREERTSRLDPPLFVCTLAFPGMPTVLHVFEPRYRLMIRRCIESSSPRFGMVLPGRGADSEGVMVYGTMLEIQSVQMLPDGRSMVETIGTHRFKLLEKGSLDGYTVGRIERVEDISVEEELALEQEAVDQRDRAGASGTPTAGPSEPMTQPPTARPGGVLSAPTLASIAAPAPSATPVPNALGPMPPTAGQPSIPLAQALPLEEIPQTAEEYMAVCKTFIEQLRGGSAPWLLHRLNNTYGSMPDDPSEFSYWMALVMPIDEYEKAKLLPIRSPRLRLKLIVHWVEFLKSSWWFSSGCVVG